MPATMRDATTRVTIAPGRERYLTHTGDLMMVVIDFEDGPMAEPDPPHSHRHDQTSYIAEGEVMFTVGETVHHVKPGDLVAIPSDVPHTLQLLTRTARLVDAFHPIRDDFLAE